MDAKKVLDPPYVFNLSPSHFFLQKENSDTTVVINRETNGITVEQKHSQLPGKPKECYGFIGIAKFSFTNYVIVITQANYIGRVKDSYILQIVDAEFMPYSTNQENPPERKKDDYFIALLLELIRSKSFYFSYDYDLTHSMQRAANFSDKQSASYLWERADYKYFWNSFLSEDFMNAGASDVIIPIINGFVQAESITIEGSPLEFILISRRDHRRAGTRFNTRGLDESGHAVNFVETEQIITCLRNGKVTVCSFAQIRGSIPLIWQQKPNLKWAPKPKIQGSVQQSSNAAFQHFTELHEVYSGISMINLIDKSGSQKMMGNAFGELVEIVKDDKLHLIWFDFHHECKKMKYENLSKLLAEVENDLSNYQ
mmetsp:Transcript_27506/g.27169  ORF Transcript_27506/g.27169 Transcript_27506/m.27169 type:complete len:369 (+) Transcript_27506:2-1108(+)